MKNFWILNPDAELELASMAAGKSGSYTSPGAVRASINERRCVFDELTLDDPKILAHEINQWKPGNKIETPVLLWCPTPSLLRQCRRHGIRVPANPPSELLLAVNDKTRLSEWGLPVVPGRTLLERVEALISLKKSHAALRLKRPFGFAGRGQRRMSRELSADDVRWLTDSLKSGPLVAEPELLNVRFRSVHLYVHGDACLVGEPLGFVCDDFGAFDRWDSRNTFGSEDLQMKHHAQALAARLLSAGYFGPAAIDFALCESGALYALDLNGRFSLGWSLGMGTLREQALELHKSQES